MIYYVRRLTKFTLNKKKIVPNRRTRLKTGKYYELLLPSLLRRIGHTLGSNLGSASN